jgi:hypothetical protein
MSVDFMINHIITPVLHASHDLGSRKDADHAALNLILHNGVMPPSRAGRPGRYKGSVLSAHTQYWPFLFTTIAVTTEVPPFSFTSFPKGCRSYVGYLWA